MSDRRLPKDRAEVLAYIDRCLLAVDAKHTEQQLAEAAAALELEKRWPDSDPESRR
jgi:hypothetical protein